MIPQHQKLELDSFGHGKATSFGIKAENMAVVAHILRSQLYSDPILAVLREYSTNATDAHIMSNQPTRPIQVTLPTRLSPILKIRDFGHGLTVDEIREIYVSYGASTKRNSNEATGMLGLGSKSGFAYGDSFLIVSHNNGVATTFNAFIDQTKVGQIIEMTQEASTENGIEIQIPVRPDDLETFAQKAISLYRFFKVKPTLVDLSPVLQSRWDKTLVELDAPLLQGTNWRVYSKFTHDYNNDCYIVMGNIGYKMPNNLDAVLSLNATDQKTAQFVRQLTSNSGGLWIDIPIGAAEIAASREALQYSEHTKKSLQPIFSALYSEVAVKLNDSFLACKTLWDAKILFAKTHDYGSPMYHLQSAVGKHNLAWNGKNIGSSDFQTLGDDSRMVVMNYSKGGRRRYSSNQRVRAAALGSYFTANPNTDVYINDLDKPTDGIANRVTELIERGNMSNVLVIRFLDATAQADWIKASGYDGPLGSLKALTPYPMSRYYNVQRAGGVGSTVIRTKHSHAVFELDLNPKSKYNSYASDDWIEDSTLDVDNGTFTYVLIDRFQYTLKADGATQADATQRAIDLRTALENMASAGYQTPTKVYGLKMSAFTAALKNKNATPLIKWAKNEIATHLTANPAVLTRLSDASYFNTVGNDATWLIGVFKFFRTNKEAFDKLDKASPLKEAVVEYDKLVKAYDKKNQSLWQAHTTAFGRFDFDFQAIAKPSVNLDGKLLGKLLTYYAPMSAIQDVKTGYLCNHEDLSDSVLFFVNCIEEKKGALV